MTIPVRTVSAEQISVAEVQLGAIQDMLVTINANFQHLAQSSTFRGIQGEDGNDGDSGETGTRGTQIFQDDNVGAATLIDGDLLLSDNGTFSRWNGNEFEQTNITLLTTTNTYTKTEIDILLNGTISSIDTDSVFSIKKGFADVANNNRLSIPDTTGNSNHDFVFIDFDTTYSFLIGSKTDYNNSVASATSGSGFSPIEGSMPKLIILQDNFNEGILLGRASTNFDDFASIVVKEITSSRRLLSISHDELDFVGARDVSISSEGAVTTKSVDKYIYVDNTTFEVGGTDIELKVISDELIESYLDINLNENVLSFRYDTDNDISHVWYEDNTSTYHFVANDIKKAEGNAYIKASRLILEESGATATFTPFDVVPVGDVSMWCAVNGSGLSISQIFDLSDPNAADYGKGLGLYKNYALCNGNNGTPDMRRKFVAGYDPENAQYSIETVAGSHERVLVVDNLPAHNHTATTGGAGGHTHTMQGAGGHTHTMQGAGGHTHTMQNAGIHNHTGYTGWGGLHNHTGSKSVRTTGRHTTAIATDANTDGNEIDLRFWDSINYDGYHRHVISNDGSHAHTINSVSNHTHVINSVSSHVHTINSVSNHTHTVVVNNTGSGVAFDNRPEFIVMAFYQKIA